MDTFSLVRPAHHVRIRLSTAEPTEFVDLTTRLADVVHESGVQTGLLNVQTTHTTTAIVVNEHEPLLQQDLHAALARLAPLSLVYRHDDLARRPGVPPEEPRNGHAHCRAFFLPTAVSLNIIDGRLTLGRWQRVFLVELDGPRTREVTAVAIGAAR
jgi:secondary thiamine-phosphate synthase enzyme